MQDSFFIEIHDPRRPTYSGNFSGPLELGRQRIGEDAPFFVSQQPDCSRIVIAAYDEDTISRQHLLLEPQNDGRLKISNRSNVRPVQVVDQPEIRPGASALFRMPVAFCLTDKNVRVQKSQDDDSAAHDDLEALQRVTLLPGQFEQAFTPFPTIDRGSMNDPEIETLVRWMQTTMSVLEVAANSGDFFLRAAKALVDVVQLDSGAVLLFKHGDWKTEVLKAKDQLAPPIDWRPSRRVLEKVRQERRTSWQTPSISAGEERSLFGISAVVAAPILNRAGDVIGALYGDRRTAGPSGMPSINKIDAMLVELLAYSVASGLSRIEQEEAATAARVQFEQFFTPELARQIHNRADLLAGRNCEVSVLFADIRRFSRISEQIGPEKTVNWVNDVLGVLSEAVLEEQGVLVDYVGDELAAMWGAPGAQPDHAERACRAALGMLERLPELNRKWYDIIGGSTEIGIGINTGVAFVGNTGSHRKFKYGPLGTTVNLASRVQGTTKYTRSTLVITGYTRKMLAENFHTRKLATVRVVNIHEPVDLFELVRANEPGWGEIKRIYEQALDEFEKKRFRAATQTLGNILSQYPDDGPSVVLLSRTVEMLLKDSGTFDPVWELPGK